jgi:hypothetical protein
MAMLKLHSGVKRDVAFPFLMAGCFLFDFLILEIKRRHEDHCFATSKSYVKVENNAGNNANNNVTLL